MIGMPTNRSFFSAFVSTTGLGGASFGSWNHGSSLLEGAFEHKTRLTSNNCTYSDTPVIGAIQAFPSTSAEPIPRGLLIL